MQDDELLFALTRDPACDERRVEFAANHLGFYSLLRETRPVTFWSITPKWRSRTLFLFALTRDPACDC